MVVEEMLVGVRVIVVLITRRAGGDGDDGGDEGGSDGDKCGRTSPISSIHQPHVARGYHIG